MAEALDLVQRFYAAFADGDLDAADQLFAADCAFTTPPGTMTKADHRVMSEAFRAALPDSTMVIDHVVNAGDEVVVEGRFIGTHTGDLHSPQGVIPASGNKIEVRFADYFKAARGQITDQRTYWDQVEMMTQLGAMS